MSTFVPFTMGRDGHYLTLILTSEQVCLVTDHYRQDRKHHVNRYMARRMAVMEALELTR